MTTISLHHNHHGHFAPRLRVVHLVALAAGVLSLGFVASTALGRTVEVQAPPASIEIYSDMNREAAPTPAVEVPAPEITTAPSSLEVLSAMNEG